MGSIQGCVPVSTYSPRGRPDDPPPWLRKVPEFHDMATADQWLERAHLFAVAMRMRRQLWLAEDDTIVGYTTASAPDGTFVCFRYIQDDGIPLEILFAKAYSMRRTARQRAMAIYKLHSPKFRARREKLDGPS